MTEPSTEAPPDAGVRGLPPTAPAPAKGRPVLWWLAGAAAGVAILIGALVLFSGGSRTPGAAHAPSQTPSPTVPGRPAFFFRVVTDPPAVTGRRGTAAANDAAISIGGRLSSFYDTVFMDPKTWAGGAPDDVWTMFDPSVADRARGDASSFTLGNRADGLVKLSVTTSSLHVRVLLDPSGEPTAAVAEVRFGATGTTGDGGTLEVTNQASFLFEPKQGVWVVVGYPDASTDVHSAPAPTSSPSPQTPGSASP